MDLSADKFFHGIQQRILPPPQNKHEKEKAVNFCGWSKLPNIPPSSTDRALQARGTTSHGDERSACQSKTTLMRKSMPNGCGVRYRVRTSGRRSNETLEEELCQCEHPASTVHVLDPLPQGNSCGRHLPQMLHSATPDM